MGLTAGSGVCVEVGAAVGVATGGDAVVAAATAVAAPATALGVGLGVAVTASNWAPVDATGGLASSPQANAVIAMAASTQARTDRTRLLDGCATSRLNAEDGKLG